MAPLEDNFRTEASVKFVFLTRKLLSITDGRIGDKKLINSCLKELNDLNYRSPIISDSDAALLLVNQLCTIVQPSDILLVKNTSQLLVNLVRCGEKIQGRTFTACERWLLEALEFADPAAWNDILLALQSLLNTGPFDSINQQLRNLLADGGLLRKFVPPNNQWSETHVLAMSCLEAVLSNRESSNVKLSNEFLFIIRNIVLETVSSTSYEIQDKQYYNKILSSCLRVLRSIISDKNAERSSDIIGQILGVVQAFMFHGIKSYQPLKPQLLRPAAMNLPEATHTVPRGRNLRNHKGKSRKRQTKKATPEIPKSTFPESKLTNKYVSDSDTSDTETLNLGQAESRVRLEALQLLNSIVQSTPTREIFGYWPQIVASGSKGDARVLTRCILREPVSKVRRSGLSTLSELLTSSRSFLIHAEDGERSSFVTFFGTVSAMLRELHFALSLVLSAERNVAVLTHALKCAAALVQGTPYARLKPGLATKLMRNCRPQIFHKDATVRVAALSVFEALASLDQSTPEILNILAKQSNVDTESELVYLNVSATSDISTEEEIEFEDIDDDSMEADYGPDEECSGGKEISSLVHACLKNISTESVGVPVRLESLRLIGALAFNVGSLVLSHLEIIATSLATAVREPEIPIALHAGRVIETIAGCLANSPPTDAEILVFWNIVFDPVIVLVQHAQTTLREVACDCLGNIGSNMLAQLSREQSILVITTLFGAVRDEESAVRAAALRALGMLVALPTLEDDVGFLMDLADIVCLALDDQNLGVRVKAAWTLANLCDCLVRQEGNKEVEPVSLDAVLPRLYQASVKAAKDNDKVKCNAVRAVGSSLYLCPDRQILKDTSLGLDSLICCATTGNDMKVRWNACRALGFVLGHNPDRILPSLWRDQVFPALCNIVCHSPNFKVRTNAAWALSACEAYGKHVITLWKSIILALENSQHVPSYVEYAHRDALVQQLCLTLSHLAVHTTTSEFPALWEEVGDHLDDTSIHMKQFQERVLPEKAGDLIKARTQMMEHAQAASTSKERQIASSLAKLFERSGCYDNFDMMSTIS